MEEQYLTDFYNKNYSIWFNWAPCCFELKKNAELQEMLQLSGEISKNTLNHLIKL